MWEVHCVTNAREVLLQTWVIRDNEFTKSLDTVHHCGQRFLSRQLEAPLLLIVSFLGLLFSFIVRSTLWHPPSTAHCTLDGSVVIVFAVTIDKDVTCVDDELNDEFNNSSPSSSLQSLLLLNDSSLDTHLINCIRREWERETKITAVVNGNDSLRVYFIIVKIDWLSLYPPSSLSSTSFSHTLAITRLLRHNFFFNLTHPPSSVRYCESESFSSHYFSFFSTSTLSHLHLSHIETSNERTLQVELTKRHRRHRVCLSVSNHQTYTCIESASSGTLVDASTAI